MKRRKIDGIVAGVLLYWMAFVTVSWVAYFVTGGVPDTLVQVGLGGGAVELVATAAIEILSNKRRKDDPAGSGDSGTDLLSGDIGGSGGGSPDQWD